ncbi:Exonuclease mut-7 [Hondaea fermentalgiana]|uniref:Exonuclease mut-7 n=1 Tax=Hondaea fermentalgiana TaxID=2315210 RepID=A0A2R5GFC8_9STRA|nr:Exonuclease mut-7 [Hondaea fermentalgiana]|eukprot:GBG26554.1 Exonuclease mut-7 [Hondaea fermentalgiana]
MHGIHGLDAVRRGDFDHVVNRELSGPSVRKLPPKERLVRDLAFAVQSAPYAMWAQREREPIKVCLEPVNDQTQQQKKEEAQDSAQIVRDWLARAKERSESWVNHLQTTLEAQQHLEDFLQERKGDRGRLVLGTYFGLLIEYWLRNCKELGLTNVKSSIVVQERATVLGSLKFVWTYEGQLMHLECSIKFFCWTGDHLVGPHLSETLLTRFRFAERKLAVGHAAGHSLRSSLGIDSAILSLALIQGYVFYPLDDYLAAKGDPRLALGLNDLARKNASGITTHADHLLPNHEKRWFALDFADAAARLAGPNPYNERWTILPKLYWLSSLRVHEKDCAEKFGTPLLNRETMRCIVESHYKDQALQREELERAKQDASQENGEMSSEKQHSFDSSHLNGPSPLMLAQLEYNEAEDVWVETSRGFVLGPAWQSRHLLSAEATGSGVPHEPSSLDIHENKHVICRFRGAVPAQQGNEGLKSKKDKSQKARSAESCEHCASFDPSTAIEAIMVEGDPSELVRSLFLVDDARSEIVQLKSNDHARHVVDRVSESLSQSTLGDAAVNDDDDGEDEDEDEDEDEKGKESSFNAADFALRAAMAIGDQGPGCPRIQSRELRTFCRLALRASTVATAQRGDESPSDSVVAKFCRFCIARGDMELLHLMLFSGRSLQTQALTLSVEASDLVESYIRDRLVVDVVRADGSVEDTDLGNVEAAAAVGLLQAVQHRFTDEELSRMCVHLVRMRQFDAATNLVRVANVPPQTLRALYRNLLTEGRTYKRAMALRRSYDELQVKYPELDYPKVRDALQAGDALQFMADTVQWSADPEEARAGERLAVLLVDSKEQLDTARNLFHAARERAGHEKIVIGIDAEWGDLQFKKRDREALEGAPCEEDDTIADDVPSYLSLWQVSIEDKYVFLLDLETLLSEPGSDVGQSTLTLLLELLDAEKVIMTGFSVHEDLGRMRAMLQPALSRTQTAGITMNIVDSLTVASAFFPEKARNLLGDPLSISLDAWTRILLGVRLDKSYQCSEWSVRPLAPEQIRYAALDAVAPVRLTRAVLGQDAGASEFEKWARKVRLW